MTSWGTCWSDVEVAQGGDRPGTDGAELLEARPGTREVAAPDVPAVDDTADDDLVGDPHGRLRDRAPVQIDRDRLDGSGGERRPRLGGELRVPRRHEEVRPIRGRPEHVVCASGRGGEHGGRRRRALRDEGVLVELHPLHAGGGKALEELRVDGEEVVEARERRSKPSGASSVGFARARSVTGPTRTGRTTTPSAATSETWATKRSDASEKTVSGPISGTR